jgi:PBP1b-binding outer membrane lipoprotein LpoB
VASALVTTLLVGCVTQEAADEAFAPKTLEPTKPLNATSVYVPGNIPPAEAEQRYYAMLDDQSPVAA